MSRREMEEALRALAVADSASAALMGLALIVGALLLWKRSGAAAAMCALSGLALCAFELAFVALDMWSPKIPHEDWAYAGMNIAVHAAWYAPLGVMLLLLARRSRRT